MDREGSLSTRGIAVVGVLAVVAAGLCGSCVRTSGIPSNQGPQDAGSAADISSEGGGAPYLGKIQVDELRTAWTTSNTIRWTWDREGTVGNFEAYELVVGLSVQDVTSRSGSAVVWTGEENPELDHYTLPNTTGNDPVVMVMTDLLQPDTTYHGQLVAFDTAGDFVVSNIATARTQVRPTAEVILFSEAPTAGYSIPANVEYRTDPSKAFKGDHYYEYIAHCEAGQSWCWENLRRQGIAKSIAAIPLVAFMTTAFYEIALACSGTHSFYSHVRLMFGGDGAPSILWVNDGWSIRCNSEYRVIQIPLRELYSDLESPIPLPLLHAESQRNVDEFTVGGAWTDASWVRLDEVRIRW